MTNLFAGIADLTHEHGDPDVQDYHEEQDGLAAYDVTGFNLESFCVSSSLFGLP